LFMLESNATQTKMDCPSESKSDSCDEPLFVLRYRREKVIKRLMLHLVLLGPFGLAAIADTAPVSVRLAGVLGLFISVPFFLDILLFLEVRLYKDRMVKIWNYVGKREVNLADARLLAIAGYAIGVGRFKFRSYNKYKRIFDRRTNVAWSYMGVFYDEMLADQDDVKKLNTLLADLTGRKVEEFEQPRIRIARLTEQEKK
jgi:hypothetical protein